jgi:hypothetical protein
MKGKMRFNLPLLDLGLSETSIQSIDVSLQRFLQSFCPGMSDLAEIWHHGIKFSGFKMSVGRAP